MKRLIYIDTETTGLNANKHAIIQLAYIIEIEGQVKARGSFRINPFTYRKPREVDKNAMEVHKITEQVLRTYDDASETFEKFLALLNRYITPQERLTFVAYNSQFDIKFVQAWFMDNGRYNDYGYYFTWKDLDVFALTKYMAYMQVLPPMKSHTLSAMCEWLGLEFDGHDAVADIEATRDLHYKLISYIKKD